LLFGQDARSSKSNFIGCFDPTCHVASVVEGISYVVFSWPESCNPLCNCKLENHKQYNGHSKHSSLFSVI